MSLNIKNKEAHKLANQLAKLTGENMTEAVTNAVRERLDRVRCQRGSGLDRGDRKSTRLNSSHRTISYAVFCLKKKKKKKQTNNKKKKCRINRDKKSMVQT